MATASMPLCQRCERRSVLNVLTHADPERREWLCRACDELHGIEDPSMPVVYAIGFESQMVPFDRVRREFPRSLNAADALARVLGERQAEIAPVGNVVEVWKRIGVFESIPQDPPSTFQNRALELDEREVVS
jgi:hypothetical protein